MISKKRNVSQSTILFCISLLLILSCKNKSLKQVHYKDFPKFLDSISFNKNIHKKINQNFRYDTLRSEINFQVNIEGNRFMLNKLFYNVKSINPFIEQSADSITNKLYILNKEVKPIKFFPLSYKINYEHSINYYNQNWIILECDTLTVFKTSHFENNILIKNLNEEKEYSSIQVDDLVGVTVGDYNSDGKLDFLEIEEITNDKIKSFQCYEIKIINFENGKKSYLKDSNNKEYYLKILLDDPYSIDKGFTILKYNWFNHFS